MVILSSAGTKIFSMRPLSSLLMPLNSGTELSKQLLSMEYSSRLIFLMIYLSVYPPKGGVPVTSM
jgi:hypothetical protein